MNYRRDGIDEKSLLALWNTRAFEPAHCATEGVNTESQNEAKGEPHPWAVKRGYPNDRLEHPGYRQNERCVKWAASWKGCACPKREQLPRSDGTAVKRPNNYRGIAAENTPKQAEIGITDYCSGPLHSKYAEAALACA